MKKRLMKKSLASLLVGASAATAQAETVVNLEFSTGSTSNLPAVRLPDVNASHEWTISWSDAELLFDGVDAWNQDVYGAFTALETPGSNNVAGGLLEVQDAGGTGSDFIRLDGLNSTTNVSIYSKLLLMWDSSNFLTNGFNTFDTRPESFFKMGLGFTSILKGYRYVIREGETYYLSNVADLGIIGATTGLKWGEFDPNDFALFDTATLTSTNGMNIAFSNMVFTNVTAVGVIANLNRGATDTTFRLANFEVGLVSEVGLPPAAPSALVVNLGTDGITSKSPANRRPDFDDTNQITYEWNTTNAFFILPASTNGSPSMPIYGGSHLTTSTAGTVNPIYPMLTPNYVGSGKAISLSGTNKVSSTHYVRGILFWDGDNFLTNVFTKFDNTINSKLSTSVQLTNGKQLNFFIREGDKYYLCFQGSTGGALARTGFETTWAEFNPADFKTFGQINAVAGKSYGVTTNAFISRTFTNVTGVGVIGLSDRANLNPVLFNVQKFSVELVPSEEGDAYAIWAEGYLPADVSDPAGDNDGDNVKNLAEYAINGNPTNAADKGITATRSNGSQFEFIHAKLANDDSVTYRLIDTTDLVSGTSPDTNNWDAQTVGPVVGDYQMVTNSYNTTPTQKFIELEVEK